MSLNDQGFINSKFLIMKKSILNLGEVLNKTQQRQVNGGRAPKCCIDWNPIERHCYEWDRNCKR